MNTVKPSVRFIEPRRLIALEQYRINLDRTHWTFRTPLLYPSHVSINTREHVNDGVHVYRTLRGLRLHVLNAKVTFDIPSCPISMSKRVIIDERSIGGWHYSAAKG